MCTALYWAEGGKARSTSGFIFVNSDPKMILLMYYWLLTDLDVPKSDLSPRISVNINHKERIGDILHFWSNLLELPTDVFDNPYYVKTRNRKVYDNHDSYFGVLRLKVNRSTFLKYKMLALIEELKKGV